MEEEKARKEREKDVIVVDESLPDDMIIDIVAEEDIATRNSSKIGDDDCTVFIFDSLRGSHPNVGKNLMSYLLVEAKDKLQIDLSSVLPDLTLPKTYVKYAKVQDQLNYCDCGLFLLHYFTTFTRSPELVKNAIMNDQPLNTAQFGTLREIRAMRIFMKDTIKELQEKAEKFKEEMRNLNKKEC
ncbi:hypothetical protein BCR33DRAFT_115159 [Rhizoclosmatium globosum]|uniref:Ubiquitin-like protease family profile domain-containing protein n=1 Tax=Rhizoclosmatium globosum TaxID=329046 RepID=A0A1Y2CL29_9FUNG|nr:hypothetical protein BCR33DRAFT_115159 [Rhizoclosmatium globosum]|eukprot:ORY47025.1 hypothetical protein BCR33DRAFT_115159 [Rhizoclosmatium globosum]